MKLNIEAEEMGPIVFSMADRFMGLIDKKEAELQVAAAKYIELDWIKLTPEQLELFVSMTGKKVEIDDLIEKARVAKKLIDEAKSRYEKRPADSPRAYKVAPDISETGQNIFKLYSSIVEKTNSFIAEADNLASITPAETAPQPEEVQTKQAARTGFEGITQYKQFKDSITFSRDPAAFTFLPKADQDYLMEIVVASRRAYWGLAQIEKFDAKIEESGYTDKLMADAAMFLDELQNPELKEAVDDLMPTELDIRSPDDPRGDPPIRDSIEDDLKIMFALAFRMKEPLTPEFKIIGEDYMDKCKLIAGYGSTATALLDRMETERKPYSSLTPEEQDKMKKEEEEGKKDKGVGEAEVEEKMQEQEAWEREAALLGHIKYHGHIDFLEQLIRSVPHE